MSKIEELIQQYCPDGVEYKELGKIGYFVRGNGMLKSDFTESGVGCIHYGQIYTYYGFSANKTKTFVSPELAKKLRKAKMGI
jgi:type I restriction enzyme, S subunit